MALQSTIQKDILSRHAQAIVDCLNPSYFFGKLPPKAKFNEIIMLESLTRNEKAKKILEMLDKNTYYEFIKTLEQDENHLGHKFIVSLLKSQEFAPKERIEDSERLRQKFAYHIDTLIEQVNVECLLSLLIGKNLITNEEANRLMNINSTPHDRVRTLCNILETKGPTAHSIFVRECLGNESEHPAHRELYTKLTNQDIPRYDPPPLKPPEGITTDDYLKLIREVRQKHQIGGDQWKQALTICNKAASMDSVYPLEMKIAFMLENCNIFILSGQSEQVFPIVKQAREMCQQLEKCNVQALEARCEWVLAKLYRCRKQPEKASVHTGTALSLVTHCEAGEERILVHYCQGCILLDDSSRSPINQNNAIMCFEQAISCANENDFGLKIFTHGKIRLAQAYVGSSSNHTGKGKNEISKADVEKADKLLTELSKDTTLNFRTRCMLLYTWFDVCQAKGDIEQARKYLEEAREIAIKQKFVHELNSIEIRLQQSKLKIFYRLISLLTILVLICILLTHLLQ